MTTEHNNQDVEFLERYLTEHPESILFARLADAYLEQERVDEAINICEEGTKKHPYYPTGHFVLGKSYMAKKLYEQAEKEFKRVLLFDPKFLAAHKLYGDLMKEIGWENTSDMSYKKILQIDPLDEFARSVVKDSGISGDDEPELESPQFDTLTKEVEAPPEPKSESIPESEEDPSVSAIAVSAEEEEMLFEEPDPETEEVIKAHFPEETTTSEQVDDDKAEEFSYILDDIFREESEEESGEKKTPAEKKKDDSQFNGSSIDAEEDDLLSQLRLPSEKDDENEEESTEKEIATVESQPEPEVEQQSETKSEQQDEVKSDSNDFTGPYGDEDFDLGFLDDDNKGNQQPEPATVEEGGGDTRSASSSLPKRKKGDKIVTPTLGEIYAAQGQYSKAIDVFETLIKKHPDNEFYIEKIAMLKKKLDESKDESKN